MIKKELLALVPQAKKYIALTILCQWLQLVSQIAVVFSLSAFLQAQLFEQDPSVLAMCLPAFAIAIVLRYVGQKGQSLFSYRASADVKKVLREKLFQKLLRLGPTYTAHVSTAEVVQLSTEGVDQMESYFGGYLPQLFYALLAPITLFAVLAPRYFKASVVLLLCVPLIPLSIVAVQKIAKRILAKYWNSYTGMGDHFLENLEGMTTLKVYGADAEKAEEMDVEAEDFRIATMRVLTMQLNSISVMDLVAYGGAAIGMFFTCHAFLNHTINFSTALSVVLLASEFFLPLRLLGSFFHIAMNGMAAADKVMRILSLEEPKDGTAPFPDGQAQLSIKNLCFSYHENAPVLQNIRLTFPEKGLVAIVGGSGCGKSTFANIIAGKYRNYAGNILFSGQEAKNIKACSLHQAIVRVGMDSHLFKGTVKQNLRMGNLKATEEDMKLALAAVKLQDEIQSSGGLDAAIAERGSNLSGGQRQRLVLARALLKPAKFYIFDEVTSNIDMESEAVIMEQIYALAKEKPVLLISHRLANVVLAEQIYLLSKGEIVQQGTHETLMQEKGLYRDLYEKQESLEQFGWEDHDEDR